MQCQRFQEHSPLGFLILVSLVGEPKRATALHEAVMRADGFLIEPGAFSRMLARLERREWIAGYEGEEGWRRYQITDLGMQALQAHERSHYEYDERCLDGQRGKERMMPLVFWVLRLYPAGWRERYEAEMLALLEEHHITLWTILDLLLGALDARLDPSYRQARQFLLLRRFKSSWRLLVASFVVFWFALLPWFWMSQIGLDDADCSGYVWQGNTALCVLRKTLGRPQYSNWGLLPALILLFLPILLMIFMAVFVSARGKKANTHLVVAQVVTVGMIVLCITCGFWLAGFWQLLPQIGQFYPQTPVGLYIGIVAMGLATVLAQVSLARAAFALRAMEKTAPSVGEEPAPPFAQARATNRGAKGAWAGLVGLLLLFIVSCSALIGGNAPDLSTLLFNWALAVMVGLITAWLVKAPDRKWEQRARSKPRWAASPLWWAAILPAPSLAFFLFGIGPQTGVWPLLFAGLVIVVAALIVKIRMHYPSIKGPLRLVASPLRLGMLALATIFTVQAMNLALSSPFQFWHMLMLVNLVSIVPAFFVRVPARSQPGQGANERQNRGAGAAPRVVSWVLFLLTCNAVYVQISKHLYLPRQFAPWMVPPHIPPWFIPPWIGGNELLMSLVMLICLIPALVVKIQTSNRRAAGVEEASEPNALSSWVWIVGLPVVFLTCVTQIQNILGPNFSTFVNVFNIWLLAGEAVLIMLLALRLGSRKRGTPLQQELPQAQMQRQSQ